MGGQKHPGHRPRRRPLPHPPRLTRPRPPRHRPPPPPPRHPAPGQRRPMDSTPHPRHPGDPRHPGGGFGLLRHRARSAGVADRTGAALGGRRARAHERRRPGALRTGRSISFAGTATLSSRPLLPGSGSGHGGHTAGRRHPASFVGDRRELTRTTPSGGALSLDRGAIGGLHARGSAISMGADARPIQIGSGDFPHQIASLRRV